MLITGGQRVARFFVRSHVHLQVVTTCDVTSLTLFKIWTALERAGLLVITCAGRIRFTRPSSRGTCTGISGPHVAAGR